MADDHALIDRIYEAAIIPENWPGILEEISTIAGCYGGTLLSIDAQQEMRHIDSEQFRDMVHMFVRDGWTKQNIRLERLAKIKYPGFVTDCDLISTKKWTPTPSMQSLCDEMAEVGPSVRLFRYLAAISSCSIWSVATLKDR